MARPLDPLSLRHFVAVCEERSIARAAEREALVASALSKRLSALEAELGVALLTRGRRGIEPTPAGAALLARARELLAGFDQIRAELGAFASGVQGSVRLFASPSALAAHLPDDIADFLAANPGIHISLAERTSPEILRGVREGSADLGVLWDQIVDLVGLQALPYRSDHLCVAIHPEHPLARRPALAFTETLDHASVNIIPGGQMDLLLRRQAALLGRLPAYRIEVSSLDAACRIVEAGLGLAIIPADAATARAAAGRLVLVRLSDTWAVRRFVVIAQPARLRTEAVERLAKALGIASAPA